MLCRRRLLLCPERSLSHVAPVALHGIPSASPCRAVGASWDSLRCAPVALRLSHVAPMAPQTLLPGISSSFGLRYVTRRSSGEQLFHPSRDEDGHVHEHTR